MDTTYRGLKTKYIYFFRPFLSFIFIDKEELLSLVSQAILRLNLLFIVPFPQSRNNTRNPNSSVQFLEL